MRNATAAAVGLWAAAIAACGDGMSAPIDSPSGRRSAKAIVESLETLASAPTGDDILYAIGSLSRETGNLVAVKQEAQMPSPPSRLSASADECMFEGADIIRFDGCSYDGLEVDGYVALYDDSGTVSLTLASANDGFDPAVEIDLSGGITFEKRIVVIEGEEGVETEEVYYTNLDGSMSFESTFESSGFLSTSDLEASFNGIEQDGRGPSGGSIGIFQSSRVGDTFEGVFVRAEFAPGGVQIY